MNTNDKKICDVLRFEGIMSGGFGMAPRIVMRDQRISIEAKAIYSYFQSFAGSKDTAFPSRDTILQDLCISKTRYYKYLQQLIDCDYIRIERDETESGWKKGNVYIIVANPESDITDSLTVKKSDESTSCQIGTKLETAKDESTSCQFGTKLDDTKLEAELKRQIDVDNLISQFPDLKADILTCIYVIKDMLRSEQVKIAGSVKDKEAIKDIASQLTGSHIIYVIGKTISYDGKIKNRRQWLQACLFNSICETPDEIDKIIKTMVKQQQQPLEKINVKPDEPKNPELLQIESDLNRLHIKRARATLVGSSDVEELDKNIILLERKIEAITSSDPSES